MAAAAAVAAARRVGGASLVPASPTVDPSRDPFAKRQREVALRLAPARAGARSGRPSPVFGGATYRSLPPSLRGAVSMPLLPASFPSQAHSTDLSYDREKAAQWGKHSTGNPATDLQRARPCAGRPRRASGG